MQTLFLPDNIMDKFDFYKEQYYQEIDRKNDISNSLSTPIGIISALVAGLFYSLTTYDFSLGMALTIPFILLFVLSVVFLSVSVYHLIKAFSDFHNGFDYAYLVDTDDLDKYYKELKVFYKQESTSSDASDNDFHEYVLSELIKSTGINQKNNKSKIFHRFLCNKHMINAFLTMCVLTIPFGVNFGLQNTKPKVQKIEVDSTLNVNLQSKQNQIFIDSLIIKINKNGRKGQEGKTNSSTDTTHQGR